jgi:5-methylcytosine-specific restriction endonuclease McrA
MPNIKPESPTHFQAFVRDKYRCVYCGEHILESFDSFAEAHLGYLKPSGASGPREDVWNRVTSCGACNSLKGVFDPVQGEYVTETNFDAAVAKVRGYIQSKRNASPVNA